MNQSTPVKKRKGPGLRDISIHQNQHPWKWRLLRWTTLIVVNLTFYLSFALDIQILEGTLSGSRLLGFHLADPFAAVQTMLASQVFNVNLIIGISTIGLFYLFIGGRVFCSWICPYHLLAEVVEAIKKRFKSNSWMPKKQITFNYKSKYYIFAGFLILAAGTTGYSIFEFINPVASLSRSFVYGPELTLAFVIFLLLFELFYSRRAWCRYFCPVGVSYSLLGRFSPTKISWKQENCSNCKQCQAVCMVPFVLKDTVNKGQGSFVLSGECTRCGLCIDACEDAALSYKIKGLDKLI